MLADITIAELVVFLLKLIVAMGIVGLGIALPFLLIRFLLRKFRDWTGDGVMSWIVPFAIAIGLILGVGALTQ